MSLRQIRTGDRALPGRLRLTAQTYLKAQRHDGGWGLAPDQVSSIVNTAEVLSVLRAGGVRYLDACVTKGIDYIVDALPKHLEDPDRGPRTRYATFALLGLSEYVEALSRPDVEELIAFATHFLTENNRADGGWRSQPNDPELSLFATATSVSALARAGVGAALVAEGAACLLAQRLPGRRGEGAAWPISIRRTARASPAQTALSVVALADAGKTRAAVEGSRWLLRCVPRWAAATEDLTDEPGTPWTHMSYSLGLRACLRTGVAPYEQRLRPAIDHLYSLWSAEERLWSEKESGANRTVRGAYAVSEAYHAIAAGINALDPLDLLEAVQPTRAAAPVSAGSIGVDPARRVFTLEANGRKHEVPCGPAALELLLALLAREEPLGGAALATALGISANAVSQRVRRLNELVESETGGALTQLVVFDKAHDGYQLAGK
jgi:hypothetical protein